MNAVLERAMRGTAMRTQARVAITTHQHLTGPATGYAMIPWVSPVEPQADLAMHGGKYPDESWFVVAKLTSHPS